MQLSHNRALVLHFTQGDLQGKQDDPYKYKVSIQLVH